MTTHDRSERGWNSCCPTWCARKVAPRSFVRCAAMILLAPVLLGALTAASGEEAGTANEGQHTGPRNEPVHLDSLLAIALRANPKIAALRDATAAAGERVPRSGALPDPVFSITAEGAPLRDPSPTNAMEKRYGLNQMIPFPGKLGLMKSMSGEEAQIARAELDRGRLEVAADLRKAFNDLALLYASIDVIEENRETLRTFAEVARVKYEVGTAMQQDLLRANVESAMEATRLDVLRRRIPAAEARINAILDRAPDAPLGRPAAGEIVEEPPDLATLEETALAVQPMLTMKQRAVAREEYGVRLAGKEGLPDFMLGLEYMRLREDPDAWSGMLGVTLPIWRGNKVGPRRREAASTLAAARNDLQAARNQVTFMVRDAWTMVSTSREQLRLYAESVLPQSEQAVAAARVAYETDRASFLDLLDAQRSLLQFRLEYEETLTEYRNSATDLGLAVGDPTMLGVSHE